MTITRRAALGGIATGAGLALNPLGWTAEPAKTPRRVVFFLQNHGFSPVTATPAGVKIDVRKLDRVEDVPLKEHTLPAWIDPLEPIKDRVTILQGLNGRHVNPYHGAPFGALGGFKKSDTAPHGETIDCALGRALPAVVPTLAFGWESLEEMRSEAVCYASSAWGANRPAPMFSDPGLAFSNLFGVAKPGADRKAFEADTEFFDLVREDADRMHEKLSPTERDKFRSYREGFTEVAEQRRKLLAMADQLAKHAPKVTDQFTKPKFESDWWDASLSVGIQALIAGVTNVLTIAAGKCHANGSWLGLGLKHQGHSLGHTGQETEADWLTLRRWNMSVLLKIVRALEAVPEGKGTMMDGTVIVYSSCHAEMQHSTGDRWPFLLIGNLGGSLRSGRYIQYPIAPKAGSRTINAFYCSLLQAAGSKREHFNLSGHLEKVDRQGPLDELMA